MQGGHRSWSDAPAKAVAEHQVISSPQFVDERLQRQKVVTIVGVAHYYKPAARLVDAGAQRIPISLRRRPHDASAETTGDLPRTVGAAIVGDDHLTLNIVCLEIAQSLPDTGTYRARLVEARHDDGDFNGDIA